MTLPFRVSCESDFHIQNIDTVFSLLLRVQVPAALRDPSFRGFLQPDQHRCRCRGHFAGHYVLRHQHCQSEAACCAIRDRFLLRHHLAACLL